MGSVRGPLVLLLAVAALAAPAAHAAGDPYASLLAPEGTCGAAADGLSLDAAAAEQAMLCLTNYARAQSGLQPLAANATLDAAGDAKLAADVRCGQFSHTPCGDPFASVFAPYLVGASSYSIGENIAWGTGDYGTPRSTMNLWLHSDGHRANILTAAYRELGIGYLPGQTFQGYAGATLWSQEFGVRSPVAGGPGSAAKPKRHLRRRVVRSRRNVRGHLRGRSGRPGRRLVAIASDLSRDRSRQPPLIAAITSTRALAGTGVARSPRSPST